MNAELELIDKLLSLDKAALERVLGYVRAVHVPPWRVTAVEGDNGAIIAVHAPRETRETHEGWVGVREASKKTKIPVVNIYRAIKKGEIPSEKYEGHLTVPVDRLAALTRRTRKKASKK